MVTILSFFCADLLRHNGFSHVAVTQGSNDQGVDIAAYKDGEKYAIQCKRYNSRLSNKPVQEVHTGRAVYNCSRALVLTNNYFTPGAINAAKATGVILWDRDKLNELIRNSTKGNSSAQTTLAKGCPDWFSRAIKYLLVLAVAILLWSCRSRIVVNNQIEHSKNEQYDEETGNAISEVSGIIDNSYSSMNEIGDTVQIAGIDFAITDYMFARHYANLKYKEMAPDGHVYCAVYAMVKNCTSSTVRFPKTAEIVNAKLTVNGETQYIEVHDDTDCFFFNDTEISSQGTLYSQTLNFEVPAELQYSSDTIWVELICKDGSSIEWILRKNHICSSMLACKEIRMILSFLLSTAC